MSELPKTFDPAAIEARWYPHWEEGGLFRPDRPDAQPWTIMMPPPNVTGSLHIGHALDNTLQDILTRHARLKGKDALWVVGTDHAGIATQMVVERKIEAEGLKRAELGRDAFLERIWEWKAESGGAITRQLRRLGASCDWANERFTMDEGFSKAVVHVFVELHKRGLLYRDKRLVNWDPHFQTAISDLEVETREINGSFWHLTYKLADGSGSISVATTRPETMLADMAVAVHPDDARYAALLGKQVRLPITGRLIPIIADEHADPELGSGAVKITPGHDFNDFEVGVRAGHKPSEMLNMLDAQGRIAQTADGLIPAELLGLDRAAARKRIVAMLEADGALDKVEDRVIATPYGDRSGVVIEPWLTDQWYVDAKTLAGPALDAVRSGAIKVVPRAWEKTYYNWLENIQPWCVSRQLWWGHQIPAWYGYGKDAEGDPWVGRSAYLVQFVAATEAEARSQAAAYYDRVQSEILVTRDAIDAVTRTFVDEGERQPGNREVAIWRDPDVLDTWFSSALWPFATLGWPAEHAATSNPFVPSEVEGRAPGDPSATRASTALGTNGAGGADHDQSLPFVLSEVEGRAASAAPVARNSTALSANGSLPGHKPSQLHGRYPNDVLISGFDILFFWDARMIMQGLEFMGDVPFKTLYLHGLVRDAQGAKMSKSKGNTVDPIGLIDRYGADALRFTLAAMESQGRDIKLDEKRVEGYRNFATKLWNAARFCQANGIGASATLEPPPADLAVNRWIVAETIKTVQALDLALAELRFDEAANTIYHFVWDRFCDWYLELIKTEIGDETRAVAGWALDQILVMLHPFMPFVTEELWHALGTRDHDLIAARWPMADARAMDPDAVAEIEWLIGAVSQIRAARSELNVPPAAKTPLALYHAGSATSQRLARQQAAIRRMARVSDITEEAGEAPSSGGIQLVLDEATLVLPLEGVIDVAAEQARLAKAVAAAEKERDSLAGRLNSEAFVAKAKPEAVAKARADHAERAGEAERLRAALARLG